MAKTASADNKELARERWLTAASIIDVPTRKVIKAVPAARRI
jgi:hypothetical protein